MVNILSRKAANLLIYLYIILSGPRLDFRSISGPWKKIIKNPGHRVRGKVVTGVLDPINVRTSIIKVIGLGLGLMFHLTCRFPKGAVVAGANVMEHLGRCVILLPHKELSFRWQ